jgi:hypothetical protein
MTQEIIVFYHVTNELNTVVEDCVVISDHWYNRGVKYTIPTTMNTVDFFKRIRDTPNESQCTDIVTDIKEMIEFKPLYRRSLYGLKKLALTDTLIPEGCDPHEIIEFIFL